jgi:hypothetical protein
VSRERIAQIYNRALTKLRHPLRAMALREFSETAQDAEAKRRAGCAERAATAKQRLQEEARERARKSRMEWAQRILDSTKHAEDPIRVSISAQRTMAKRSKAPALEPPPKPMLTFHATKKLCPKCELPLLDVEVLSRMCFVCNLPLPKP